MKLVPTYERKETLKKYEDRYGKIRNLIWSITNNSDNYDEKHLKIKFNSDDNLLLKKCWNLKTWKQIWDPFFIKATNTMHIFLDECLHKLKILEYDRIVVSKGADVKILLVCINQVYYFSLLVLSWYKF